MKVLEFYDKQIGEKEGIINKFLNKWIFTVDHKTIGTMYITFSILAGIIGTLLSLVIRMELSTGNMLEGDSQQYNVIVTAHGLIMIFFMVMPAMLGGFANWFLPIMVGAPDVAKGRISLPVSTCVQYNAKVILEFALQDIKQATAISQGLGSGNGVIKRVPQNKGCKLTISKRRGLRRFPTAQVIEAIKVNESSGMTDSWFSGFIDAKGSFNLGTSMPPTQIKSLFRFKLEQKENMQNASLKKVFDVVATELESKARPRKQTLILEVTKEVAIKKLIEYLGSHRLYSSKYYVYGLWRDLFLYIKRNARQIKTVAGQTEVNAQIKKINKTRAIEIEKEDVKELTSALKGSVVNNSSFI
ncbi:hypothetical protein RB653_003316 (mitochondrion) [Dictyostelium firmibasis]|uniref:Cytochrome oxidase subunit I profile domain-containing protein n=1 Tax=Dictyostelium firmibasis TaxID=79012 RepID=A0AAN7TKD5_9MYCE